MFTTVLSMMTFLKNFKPNTNSDRPDAIGLCMCVTEYLSS